MAPKITTRRGPLSLGRARLEALVARNPVAIVQFGSSLYPEEHIQGVSDFDVLVIGDSPRSGGDGNLDDCLDVTPKGFLRGLLDGASTYLHALRDGEVLYDPDGLVRQVRSLDRSQALFQPTIRTLNDYVQSVGNQLGSALTTYFSSEGTTEPGKMRVLRNLYAAAKSFGYAAALAERGELPRNLEELTDILEDTNPALVELIVRRRQDLLDRDTFDPTPSRGVAIRSDRPGVALLEMEEAYVSAFALVDERYCTSDLLEMHSQCHAELVEIRAVRIHHHRRFHLLLGKTSDGFCVFGMELEAESGNPVFIHRLLRERDDLDAEMRRLVLLR